MTPPISPRTEGAGPPEQDLRVMTFTDETVQGREFHGVVIGNSSEDKRHILQRADIVRDALRSYATPEVSRAALSEPSGGTPAVVPDEFAGHTPAPWSVPHFALPQDRECKDLLTGKASKPCECGFVLSDWMVGAVATVHYRNADGKNDPNDDNPLRAEAEANARLIAAAPSLLQEVLTLRAKLAAKDDAIRLVLDHLWPDDLDYKYGFYPHATTDADVSVRAVRERLTAALSESR